MGGELQTVSTVADLSATQLRRLVVLPIATIGVLAAVLTWEIEHVGSIVLSLAILGGGVAVGVAVARRLRIDMEQVAGHYESLLERADTESRRAESASRVKDEFLTTLSHELRTPLNSILGWAHLLATGKLDATHSVRAIRAIERAGWSQSRLIENLLDMSRIAAGKLQIAPRSTAMQPLVEAAVDALRPAAEAKHIALAVSIAPEVGATVVDPDRLQQVVWNLVSNAIKFTPAGGGVEVSMAIDGDQISLRVRDTGIGFRPDVAAHLFERFRQGDSSSTRAYGGLGLGLGIVRHIVELHGGTVSAASGGEQQGSTFEVRLPQRSSEEQPPASPAIVTRAASLKGVLVLVVDDDPQALEFVRSALEQSGARVATASSAREARESFGRERPDVIVSDVMMPGEDGLQLIREIRRLEAPTRHPTPAAALSALARREDRRRMFSAGYQMHVAKPIDPSELVLTVQRLANQERVPESRAH
jgi:signal transduction histidine kinase/ActR/RegA family two-component response regulator